MDGKSRDQIPEEASLFRVTKVDEKHLEDNDEEGNLHPPQSMKGLLAVSRRLPNRKCPEKTDALELEPQSLKCLVEGESLKVFGGR